MDATRPYLIIPKLIEQPTWGGSYIAQTKGWENHPKLKNLKIGQSYELFSGSNLSLLASTTDPEFFGEITNAKAVYTPTRLERSISLQGLIAQNPAEVLGTNESRSVVKLNLLIKFTQALGNSFQLHIKDGLSDPKWKSKPESWYFFEPGVVTLGVNLETDWRKYEEVVTEIERQIQAIGGEMQQGSLSYDEAKKQIKQLLTQYDPWQFVNLIHTRKDELIDLSTCGIHHSWEEDPSFPLGNVVYELQVDVSDEVSTMRSFDKGKIAEGGSARPLHIADYFRCIDRTALANNPQTHRTQAKVIQDVPNLSHVRLLQTNYYTLEKLTFKTGGNKILEHDDTFRHLFVKKGSMSLMGAQTILEVGQGHAVFVPAACKTVEIVSPASSEILISY